MLEHQRRSFVYDSKGVDFVMVTFLYVLSILFGLLPILFGLYFFLRPDSDWVRLIWRIPDDVVQEDVDLALIKLRGMIGIIGGTIITVMAVWSCFVL